MERQSWKEYRCKIGQGKACCKYLVSYKGVCLCSKKTANLPHVFVSFPEAEGDGEGCPGVDLCFIERCIAQCYDIDDKLAIAAGS